MSHEEVLLYSIHQIQNTLGFWRHLDKTPLNLDKQVEIKRCIGGASNIIWSISLKFPDGLKASEPRTILYRIYVHGPGTEKETRLIHRLEALWMNVLSKASLAPYVYLEFKDGRFEEFMHDYVNLFSIYSASGNIIQENWKINKIVAKKMAELHDHHDQINKEIENFIKKDHSIEYEDKETPRLTMDFWHDIIMDFDKIVNLNWEEIISTCKQPELIMKYKLIMKFGIDSVEFKDEMKKINKVLHKSNLKKIFCHLDLQPGNIMIEHDTNKYEEKSLDEPKLVFIDYEYARFAPRALDISNYFCEWMSSYIFDDNNSSGRYQFKSEQYPSRDHQKEFLCVYLNHLKACDLNTVSDAIWDDIFKELDFFMLVSDVKWCLWAIMKFIQNADDKELINFDYINYALNRWTHYNKHKNILLKENTFNFPISRF